MTGPAASRDLAADLLRPSQMWLGSRSAPATSSATRLPHRYAGRSGPASSAARKRRTWLLFTHKHDYLQATADRFPGAVRAFCIPRAAVAASPRGERILLCWRSP